LGTEIKRFICASSCSASSHSPRLYHHTYFNRANCLLTALLKLFYTEISMSLDAPSNIAPIENNRNPIYRLITRWTSFNLPLKIASMALFLGLCGTGLYFALAQSGQISFIGNTPYSTPVPVTPPVTPSPHPSSANCVSGVYSAEISHSWISGVAEIRRLLWRVGRIDDWRVYR